MWLKMATNSSLSLPGKLSCPEDVAGGHLNQSLAVPDVLTSCLVVLQDCKPRLAQQPGIRFRGP